MAHAIRVREFEPRDYERVADIDAAIDPSTNTTAEWLRQRDLSRDPRHFRVRFVAECDGMVVGWGQTGHKWWAFHPHKFVMRLNVEPAHQGRGVGSALFARLLEAVSPLAPQSLQTETPENRPAAIRFVQQRRFAERSRRWESRLPLDSAVTHRSASLPAGIVVTTYADEVARGEERMQRDLYDLEIAAARAEPDYEAGSEMVFEQFVAYELNARDFLADGAFLALDGERVVGVSRLTRDTSRDDVAHVGFTGVHPEYQGRGIAFALKMRSVEYARAHGFREIRTQNDTRNGPMLHINDALGFRRGVAQIVFERTEFSSDREREAQ